jgi:hypothetical protein
MGQRLSDDKFIEPLLTNYYASVANGSTFLIIMIFEINCGLLIFMHIE